jgi:hypothetical protein
MQVSLKVPRSDAIRSLDSTATINRRYGRIVDQLSTAIVIAMRRAPLSTQ